MTDLNQFFKDGWTNNSISNLTDLLDSSSRWTELYEESLPSLIFDFRAFVIMTDAYDIGIGAMLLQMQMASLRMGTPPHTFRMFVSVYNYQCIAGDKVYYDLKCIVKTSE
eukprot:GHVO01028349.1.p1 GENE.GHVO01028349.1~~GHVO01028349.1.p1  ORF type:complete len:110 (-),score=0.67 GHVO01028349.1:409-738(-)